MYKLSEETIKKIIIACNKYADQSSDPNLRRQYTSIVSQLHTYIEQNFNYDNGRRH